MMGSPLKEAGREEDEGQHVAVLRTTYPSSVAPIVKKATQNGRLWILKFSKANGGIRNRRLLVFEYSERKTCGPNQNWMFFLKRQLKIRSSCFSVIYE